MIWTFSVVDTPPMEGKRPWSAYLAPNTWNDFGFQNTFNLSIFDENLLKISLGIVKIGRRNQGNTLKIPDKFEKLSEDFFSIGQNQNYYETIASFPIRVKKSFFEAMNDCAYNTSILSEFIDEPAMEKSLLRFIEIELVMQNFHRIAHGLAELTPFKFKYNFPQIQESSPVTLKFSVEPYSIPPTNIHVLIGRNGVGKTSCLRKMTRSLFGSSSIDGEFVQIESDEDESKDEGEIFKKFSNLVTVAFSAFDPFEPIVSDENSNHTIRHAYIGLREYTDSIHPSKGAPTASNGETFRTKSPDDLSKEFMLSFSACCFGPRSERMRAMLEILSTDPIFNEMNFALLLRKLPTNSAVSASIHSAFSKLSSGHKIVILTITRLVELIDERSLVLVDEPESHLHPPLLSAFIRALSVLLTNRNGVAIIATHSPVVLQEVPRKCVWVMNRTGDSISVERPSIQTFGENVGILTREIFGLEVTHSGYHRMIENIANEVDSYEDLLARFKNKLGAEARSIARVMFSTRKKRDE